VGQRIYGLALGYEDLNDHKELRRKPLLAVVADCFCPALMLSIPINVRAVTYRRVLHLLHKLYEKP
jgi:hypothetical protein